LSVPRHVAVIVIGVVVGVSGALAVNVVVNVPVAPPGAQVTTNGVGAEPRATEKLVVGDDGVVVSCGAPVSVSVTSSTSRLPLFAKWIGSEAVPFFGTSPRSIAVGSPGASSRVAP